MGRNLMFYKVGGNTKKLSKMVVEPSEFDELSLRCPNKDCRGIVFPDRDLINNSTKTSKFGSCALCGTIIFKPKSFGLVKKDGGRMSIMKSMRLNSQAYDEKCLVA